MSVLIRVAGLGHNASAARCDPAHQAWISDPDFVDPGLSTGASAAGRRCDTSRQKSRRVQEIDVHAVTTHHLRHCSCGGRHELRGLAYSGNSPGDEHRVAHLPVALLRGPGCVRGRATPSCFGSLSVPVLVCKLPVAFGESILTNSGQCGQQSEEERRRVDDPEQGIASLNGRDIGETEGRMGLCQPYRGGDDGKHRPKENPRQRRIV